MAALSVGAVAAAVAHLEGPSHVLGAPATVLRTFISTLLPPAPAATTPGGPSSQAGAVSHVSGGGAAEKKAGKKKVAGDDDGDAQAQQGGGQQVSDDAVHMQDADDSMLSFEVPESLDLFASD
jgi:hypothetical protein